MFKFRVIVTSIIDWLSRYGFRIKNNAFKSNRFWLPFSILLIISLSTRAQFLDKSFYLVDSLESDILSEADKKLLDSLLRKVRSAEHDTTKLNFVNRIVEDCWNDDVWPRYNEWMFRFSKTKLKTKINAAEKKHYTKIIALYYNNMGYLAENRGNNPEALAYITKALKIQLEINDKPGAAASYHNLGKMFGLTNDTAQQIVFYKKSLEIKEELNDYKGMIVTLNNIAYVLEKQGKLEMQFVYFKRNLYVASQIKDFKSLALCYHGIGRNYLERYRSSKNKSSIVHFLDSSLVYSLIGLQYRLEISDIPGAGYSYYNLGMAYELKGDLKRAQENYQKGYDIGSQIGYPVLVGNTASRLAEYFKDKKDWAKAFKYFEISTLMKDSLSNIEDAAELNRQLIKLEYQTQKIKDSLEGIKQIAIKDLEVERANLKVQHQRKQRWWMSAAMVVMLVFIFFIINRFRLIKKQKNIIESHHEELISQKFIIENAHDELERKNNLIVDSIDYAKRIQNTMLPSIEELSEILGQTFIMYYPKDIVSGDFYWAAKLEDYSDERIFSLADCTGHGVPGAFMSMVGFSLLEKAVNQLNITSPAEVLANLHTDLYQNLRNRNQKTMVDGMDVAIMKYNEKTKKIIFAGARNNLILISDGKLQEFKGDKSDLGSKAEKYKFTEFEIQLKKGDCIYLFTDGYQDQRGGEHGKRLYSTNFKKLLCKVSELPFERQSDYLKDFYFSWKRDHEQIDDLLVFGMKCD